MEYINKQNILIKKYTQWDIIDKKYWVKYNK